MTNKSILLKSIICGLVYFVLSLAIILAIYIVDLNLYSGIVLGLLCGIIISAVTVCDTRKRTVIARSFGILSAFVTQQILYISGIPYYFIEQMYKDEAWFREIGHLTVNEVLGYNWGLMLFWRALLILFVISVVSMFLFHTKKNFRF